MKFGQAVKFGQLVVAGLVTGSIYAVFAVRVSVPVPATSPALATPSAPSPGRLAGCGRRVISPARPCHLAATPT